MIISILFSQKKVEINSLAWHLNKIEIYEHKIYEKCKKNIINILIQK